MNKQQITQKEFDKKVEELVLRNPEKKLKAKNFTIETMQAFARASLSATKQLKERYEIK